MNVNILGTEYKIIFKNYKDDEAFEKRSIDGYCSAFTKEIVVCDLHSKEQWKTEPEKAIEICHRDIIRHEIVHAFLNESGLQDSTFAYDGAWSKCEEMVDWFALQGEKIYNAWLQVEKDLFAPKIFYDGKELAKAVTKEFEKNTKRTMDRRFT